MTATIDQIRSAEVAMSNEDVFKFDNNVEIITLPLLEKSIRVESKSGKALKTRPEQSWTTLNFIAALLESAEMNYTLDTIYVQKAGSYARLRDEDVATGWDKNNAPISKWEFQKVLSKFFIPGLNEENNHAAIGVNFHDKGCEIGFGMNVSVCQNFNIMGATILRSYSFDGHDGDDWEKMILKLEKWVKEMDQIWKVQIDVMHAMKSHVVPLNAIDLTIGKLYRSAIKQAYFAGPYTPFDTHMLSNFVQEAYRQHRSDGTVDTVWDLFNWGTSIMKPGIINDMGGTYNAVSSWSDLLCKEFGIVIEDVEPITVE